MSNGNDNIKFSEIWFAANNSTHVDQEIKISALRGVGDVPNYGEISIGTHIKGKARFRRKGPLVEILQSLASGLNNLNNNDIQSKINAAGFTIFAKIKHSQFAESLGGKAVSSLPYTFADDEFKFIYNTSNANTLGSGENLVKQKIESDIQEERHFMAMAIYSNSSDGQNGSFEGILVWTFTGSESGGKKLGGTARTITNIASLFINDGFNGNNDFWSVYPYFIPRTGNLVTGAESGWRYSNGSAATASGYYNDSKFSADDGAWGIQFGSNVEGNDPGPYLVGDSSSYGINNPNSSDAGQALDIAGSDKSNFKAYVFYSSKLLSGFDINDISIITYYGADDFAYINCSSVTNFDDKTFQEYISSFGITGSSTNDASTTWSNGYSGLLNYDFRLSNYSKDYFKYTSNDYGLRFIHGDHSNDGPDWCVIDFGPVNNGDFDGNYQNTKGRYFGGEVSTSGGGGGFYTSSSNKGMLWGFNKNDGWKLLYQLPLGVRETAYNKSNGKWFTTGGTLVISGDGKRVEYDTMKLTAVGFSVASSIPLPLYEFTSHTFTNCNATGKDGPTLANCTSSYSSTSWASNTDYFNMSTQGIQEWTVPISGDYDIDVYGAQGGNHWYNNIWYYGGEGANIKATFTLNKGDKYSLIVGQQGENADVGSGQDNAAPGGGGGSFIWSQNDNTLLIAAGGGGAGFRSNYANRHATKNTNGYSAESLSNGGTDGNGGKSNATGSSYWAGGGCGWLTNGTGGNNSTDYDYTKGINGAEGGRRPLDPSGGYGGDEHNDCLLYTSPSPRD